MADAAQDIAAALAGVAIDPLDARVLLQEVLGVGHAYLIAHPERVLGAAEHARFAALVERRRAGEPVAYLVGWREFYGGRFHVDPAVLIPRPETELLVDQALERMPAGRALRVLDLGTGSGNIAVTLALERPQAAVTAVDRSAAALAVAAGNAVALGAQVDWRCGDWLAPVAGERFDLIVSNPPYVAAGDPHLARGDLRFEPPHALVAGADGLASIRHLVAAAGRCLEPGGWLLFEHGCDQAEACAALLHAAGYVEAFGALDLAGQPRVSGGRKA
jgi:release factor glutamine methyltransferase